MNEGAPRMIQLVRKYPGGGGAATSVNSVRIPAEKATGKSPMIATARVCPNRYVRTGWCLNLFGSSSDEMISFDDELMRIDHRFGDLYFGRSRAVLLLIVRRSRIVDDSRARRQRRLPDFRYFLSAERIGDQRASCAHAFIPIVRADCFDTRIIVQTNFIESAARVSESSRVERGSVNNILDRHKAHFMRPSRRK